MNSLFRPLFFAFAWLAAADVPVLFKSDPLNQEWQRVEPAPIAFNEPPQISQYRLQLFFSVTNAEWQAVGTSIPVRSDPLGTFDGGIRILRGVNEGQHVDLMILVFDKRVCATWQSALAKIGSIGDGGGVGSSAAFDYVYSPASATSNLMVNLPRIYMHGWQCSFRSQPSPTSRECDEDAILFMPEYSFMPGDFDLHLHPERTPNSPVGLVMGTLLPDGRAVRYVPKPATYGEDFVYQHQSGGFCDAPLWQSPKLTLRVRPSPRRPYLVTANGKLKLRGLADQRYRLERSTDLGDWEPRGEVVGNYTEVMLPQDLVKPGETQFIRAVILPP